MPCAVPRASIHATMISPRYYLIHVSHAIVQSKRKRKRKERTKQVLRSERSIEMLNVSHIMSIDILITQRRTLQNPVHTERRNARERESVDTNREIRWSKLSPFLASNANDISVETWRQTQILIARKHGPSPNPRCLRLSVC